MRDGWDFMKHGYKSIFLITSNKSEISELPAWSHICVLYKNDHLIFILEYVLFPVKLDKYFQNLVWNSKFLTCCLDKRQEKIYSEVSIEISGLCPPTGLVTLLETKTLIADVPSFSEVWSMGDINWNCILIYDSFTFFLTFLPAQCKSFHRLCLLLPAVLHQYLLHTGPLRLTSLHKFKRYLQYKNGIASAPSTKFAKYSLPIAMIDR